MKTRTTLWIMMLLALAAGALGCAGGQSAQTTTEQAATGETGAAGDAAQDEVAKAAAIAKEIEAAPDRAVEILESHGMTPEQWEALMYDIASDPARAEAYAAAKSGT